MEFYIMRSGIWKKISPSQRQEHATFFEVENKERLAKQVEYFVGPYAHDTGFSRIKKILDDSAGRLKIKVCGPAIFSGRLIGVEKVGGNNWNRKGDSYLKTEIVPNKLYCYSWIANANGSDHDACCMFFEIIKEEKAKD